MAAIVEIIKSNRPKSLLSTVMVVGVPNCGKSSIINAMKVAAKKQGKPTSSYSLLSRHAMVEMTTPSS
jgi:ribosome biogenesis GTPase A